MAASRNGIIAVEIAAPSPRCPPRIARWYDSVANTIYPVLRDSVNDPEKAERSAMARKLILDLTFHGRFEDRAYAIGVYDAHNAAVQAAFGAERLLTFNVAEGWGPLCDFLGVEVPDEDFPRTNTTDEFRDRTGLDGENVGNA